MRGARLLERAFHAGVLQGGTAGAQARGVDGGDRQRKARDRRFEVVARRAGFGAHERARGSAERVEQARLAGVRRAHHGHAQAVAQRGFMARGPCVSRKF